MKKWPEMKVYKKVLYYQVLQPVVASNQRKLGDSHLWCGVFFFFKKKWANPGLFLFIFVLFKHNIIEKTLDFSGIRTRIIGVVGEHADHLTTTTAHLVWS